MYYVCYEVNLGNGTTEMKQGPWTRGEAEIQAADIAGYEGITNCRLVHVDYYED